MVRLLEARPRLLVQRERPVILAHGAVAGLQSPPTNERTFPPPTRGSPAPAVRQ
jgi:hypothetical protein